MRCFTSSGIAALLSRPPTRDTSLSRRGLSLWMWLVCLMFIRLLRRAISSANLLFWQRRIISISAASSSSMVSWGIWRFPALFNSKLLCWVLFERMWMQLACFCYLLRHKSSLLYLIIHATALSRWVQEEKWWINCVTGSMVSVLTWVAFTVVLSPVLSLTVRILRPLFLRMRKNLGVWQPYFFLKISFNSYTPGSHVRWIVSCVDLSPLVCVWDLVNFSNPVSHKGVNSDGLIVDVY